MGVVKPEAVKKEANLDYQKIMDQFSQLPTYTLVALGGRVGVDFVHSLLDSHPQILTYNGYLFLYQFWSSSKCVAAKEFSLGDLVDEFIGTHIEQLKSRYDLLERKDQLGDNADQSIDIDLVLFKQSVLKLLEAREVNSRNMVLAICAAYSICLGQDLGQKRIFFHHHHHYHTLDPFLKDFPDAKIFCMTRDPRASFVSHAENGRRYLPQRDNGMNLFVNLKRLLEEADPVKKFNKDYMVARVEDLGNEEILKKLARWLNIDFVDSMKQSTWGGLAWHGDRLTVNKTGSKGLSRDVLINHWEQKLSGLDKYLFNYLLNESLRHYRYSFRPRKVLDAIFVPFLILLPFKYERGYFSFSHLKKLIQNKEYEIILRNISGYIKRVKLFYRHYLKVIFKKGFKHPYLQV